MKRYGSLQVSSVALLGGRHVYTVYASGPTAPDHAIEIRNPTWLNYDAQFVGETYYNRTLNYTAGGANWNPPSVRVAPKSTMIVPEPLSFHRTSGTENLSCRDFDAGIAGGGKTLAPIALGDIVTVTVRP